MSEMDRFVEFLRSAAAGYNEPPPTPRDQIWARIETSVSEPQEDPFVEFLRSAAAGYNEPPPTPRDTMWSSIQATLAGDGESRHDTTGPVPVDDPLSGVDYHPPPTPPRDEMWERIEAAWQMRRSAGAGAREAGLETLTPLAVAGSATGLEDDGGARWARPRSAVPWITGVAIAASLVIGIAIGRRSADELDRARGTETIAQIDEAIQGVGNAAAADRDPSAPGTPAVTPASADRDVGAGLEDPERQVGDPESGGERLETAPVAGTRLVAAPEQGSTLAAPRVSAPTAASPADRRAAVLSYATTEHFGRAEALLASFRTGDEEDDAEISGWARDLLAETRLLLDTPGDRDPRARALLEELELVLIQIAGLGSGAPPGERALVSEGLERQGTLPRLRAVTPAGPGPGLRVGT